MYKTCEEFVGTCEWCEAQLSRPLGKIPTQPIDTPPRPFAVIHVDHKGPLQRTTEGYVHILVVVCALTRFTLLIPVKTTSAEETLRVLYSRMVCVFGRPLAIVSDNGPAFRASLQNAAAKFFDWRHAHVLPYSAQANGTAEASVKRIAALLQRQCGSQSEWHRLLSTSQLLLNATTHTSLGVSPYMALFGREPYGLD